jgi:uncharacterized protein with FMN-binding domain
VTRLGRALTALFLANGALVVALFWSALDPSAFGSLAGWLNAAGRITALVGTYLVLVQLILRTHVPWLVGAFGKDRLKWAHTWNGYASVLLLLAHGVLQIVGYALQDRVDVLSEIWLLIQHYEGMVLAFASLFLLGALTLLALERFRHRIPWPTWRALHLYAYVAVALAVPHEIATGSDFIDAPLAVAYWTALQVAVFLVLLAARVPVMWRALGVAGRPQPAVAAVGALIIGAYLLGSIRFAPDAQPAVTNAAPSATARPTGTAAPAAAGTATPAPSPLSGASIAVLGDAVDTPYGPAQVRVILTGGQITDVEPVLLPHATKRSNTISNSAEYWLHKRALAAQSSHFDVLSGASYTSHAYMESLESALRAAGIVR